MPRIARILIPDVSVHVIQRGINRAQCFFADADYVAYLGYLKHFAERFGCSVHAYCLMTNHIHLFMTPRNADGCALMMKNLGQNYVQRINKALGRSGTLWEGRYRSCLVRSPHYALACYRYIELNPVRAGMAAHPAQYRWSSYDCNAGGRNDSFLACHSAYLSLAGDLEGCRQTYRGLLDQPPPVEAMEAIRKATRRGCVVGARRRPRGRPKIPK